MSQRTTYEKFFKKKKRPKRRNEEYSFLKNLREEGKSNRDFELMLHNLSLEEIIIAKLEITSKSVAKGKFYGLPLLHAQKFIFRDALIRFALSATSSLREASRFLGINEVYLNQILLKYDKNNFTRK